MGPATTSEMESKGYKSANNFGSTVTDQEDQKARAVRVAHLSPLRYKHNAKIPRFTFGLDHEERHVIANGQEMSKTDIWEMLERKRLEELHKAAVNL